MLSRNMEYFFKRLKAFQKIVSIFKINPIDFRVFCFYMYNFEDL